MDAFAVSENILPEQEKPDVNGSQSTSTEESNKFQRAIASWRGIDLTNTIPKLDATASEIVANQRDALVQRKDLAQKTKDFRKLDDASKLTEYKGLLKAYQTFIDLLTTHGKTSSSAFLQLYSQLSEAPDPYPLLEASVDSLVASEDTVPKLTAEKEHLQKSVAQLTRQLETTEKRLEEESEARKKLEESQESKIKEIESSWEAVLSEKSNNWEAKEKSLEEKIENQERLVKELKASLEVSQRLGRDEDVDSARNTATAAELEIVVSDLEKTSLRLAEVEARNEQMRLELAQAVSHSQIEQKPIEDDPSYLRLQSENSALIRKLDAARFDRDTERHDWESKIRQIERTNAKLSAEKDEFRSKVEKYADYEDIKRELEVIKSIEFSTGDDDDSGNVPEELSGSMNGSAKSKENSLEQLLMARNKKLSNELTVLRVSHRDLQSQIETLREESSGTKVELEKSQQLCATLENDLLRMQKSTNALPSAAMSVAGTYTSRFPSSRRGGGTSPTSSIISGFDQAVASANTMDAIRAGEAVGGGSGILPMIQAQRDRFKQKNAKLEEELSKTYATVKSLRSEIASLQKDNLNLYEKTRYVSTYSRNQGGASTSASSYANRPSAASVYASDETPSGVLLDKYQSAYEAQISPFAAFRGREATRAYKRMSLPERLVFSITRVVLANRTSRNIFAAYCFALHILLFVMLYSMSAVEIEKHHIDNLANGAAAAAAGVAGGGGSAGIVGKLHGDDWQQEGFSN
ncbi:Golgi membrane protein (Coy1), putative [Talaromyces stipitatus ATCC 10500]|uniref:Protein CASP n=1 Tax=Talaromyces stipitatus (strain ATCC 10500 / CBS 375.48 / QM 6759 / NRRL 1006) TaxID=441959 RepID=B8M1W0_TALSN|nr:Golgi membrane protein (Coy1), putative [Talaromyces stipitatus ATCC 10500]EED21338.1 Golgi membrane protein (Coy1), putative [Talaromyces stipitatus ATCC 10500]